MGFISKINSFFSSVSSHTDKVTKKTLKFLDIKEFPVKGAVFGQGHWERCSIQRQYKKIEIEIKINPIKGGNSWAKVHQLAAKSQLFLTREKINLFQLLGLKFNLWYPNWGEKSKCILIGNFDADLGQMIQDLRLEEYIANVNELGEEQEFWASEKESLHDKSTGLVYEGIGNNPITLRGKGVMIAAVTPIYALLTVVFNVVSIAFTPIYSIGFILYRVKHKTQEETFKQILSITWKKQSPKITDAISNIIRTPFFAIGFFFSCLYMVLDPYNGLKMAGGFEYHWNHCIDIEHSFWFFPQKKFSLTGDEGISFALAGCLFPRAKIIREDGEEYRVAKLQIPGDTNAPKIKADRRVVNIKSDWFLLFPFCCPFSFPSYSRLSLK